MLQQGRRQGGFDRRPVYYIYIYTRARPRYSTGMKATGILSDIGSMLIFPEIISSKRRLLRPMIFAGPMTHVLKPSFSLASVTVVSLSNPISPHHGIFDLWYNRDGR